MRVLDLNINFMGGRLIAAGVSAVVILISLAALLFQGLNLGLDFTGGTLVEVEFEQPASPDEVRQVLEANGYENGLVQYFGTERDLLIRMPPQMDVAQANLGDDILAVLREAYPGVLMRQSNYVGPAVGEELTEDGGLALLAALFVVMLYILFRFTKQFSVGAVVALVHDVVFVLGCFAVAQWTFDLSVLAALLAVIGYSLNDTIVVSDRIRENFRKVRRGTSVEIINRSLNQTLGRTLITSFTTLVVLLALLIAGGEMIRGFATALTIGVMVGTYSSIYVASNVLLFMKISREDLLVPEKENADEALP
ncbi:MAG: protein translocase subunit SecF [Gammaproteobacteria bacterium]|nr:protein translocase subunit SecF [Gammaproteobacteria bacterium]|tara:strand:+ start:281 stop:1207 length:927 start_codon:yes stop_codon:yes gene_type:complete